MEGTKYLRYVKIGPLEASVPQIYISPLPSMITPTHRPLPDKTQHSQETNMHASNGIRNCNLSTREQNHALDRAATGIGKVEI